MSKDNDGGPAFPPQVFRDGDGLLQEVSNYGMQSGMSLRDYFAAKAMQAGLVGATLPGLFEGDPEAVDAAGKAAVAFYLIADAMLAARAA